MRIGSKLTGLLQVCADVGGVQGSGMRRRDARDSRGARSGRATRHADSCTVAAIEPLEGRTLMAADPAQFPIVGTNLDPVTFFSPAWTFNDAFKSAMPWTASAVDVTAGPYGTPLWIDTTEPLSATPLRRVVMAQDTGGAITGAVRIDYFWGTGEAAEQQAGRMKQPVRVWALWPR